MKPRRLSDVARAVDGLLLGDDVVVTSVCTDSRRRTPGALFVALPGEHTDGGLFVPEAFQRARPARSSVTGSGSTGPSVVGALHRRGAPPARHRRARRRSGATVVGVTGANGKTSTKDMTAAVLARRFRTHASPESFNNEVGLPVTLLGAPADTEVVVAELGARRKGDVTLLCEIARPDVVVVTNVGVAHMEIFGSWEAIVEASAEPVEALGPDGVGVLNADDPVVAGYAARSDGRVVTFGMSACGRRPRRGVCARRRRACAASTSRPATSGRRVAPRRCPASTWCRTRSPRSPSGSALGVPLDDGRRSAQWRRPSRTGGWRRSRPPTASAW